MMPNLMLGATLLHERPRASEPDLTTTMAEIGRRARAAAGALALASPEAKISALGKAARVVRERASQILAANARDLEEGEREGLTSALLDRLALDPKRLEAIAAGLEAI